MTSVVAARSSAPSMQATAGSARGSRRWAPSSSWADAGEEYESMQLSEEELAR